MHIGSSQERKDKGKYVAGEGEKAAYQFRSQIRQFMPHAVGKRKGVGIFLEMAGDLLAHSQRKGFGARIGVGDEFERLV